MIEEIVIVKDGRLSLEVAIDTEDPEASIEKYFNVNFQGITTAKEMKKIEEAKKLNTSQLMNSKKTKDFDKAKTLLNNAVKKQVNYLLNEVCEDNSILDKTTKIDNKKEHNQVNNNTKSEYMKNEPIKNEKGNFKYIKIIDIRKNENFGGLYMFMRRPSPLSLKVKSKFAELPFGIGEKVTGHLLDNHGADTARHGADTRNGSDGALREHVAHRGELKK